MDTFIDNLYGQGAGAPQGDDILPPWLRPQQVITKPQMDGPAVNPALNTSAAPAAPAAATPGQPSGNVFQPITDPTQGKLSPPSPSSPFAPLATQVNTPLSGDFGAPGSWSDPNKMVSAGTSSGPSAAAPAAADPNQTFVNEIMARRQDLAKRQAEYDNVVKGGPDAMTKKNSIWEKLGAIAVAGTTGYAKQNAGAGMDAGRGILDANKVDAQKKYDDKVKGAASSIDESRRGIEDDERLHETQQRDQDRVDARADRDRQFQQTTKFHNDELDARKEDNRNREADREADNKRADERFGAEQKHWTQEFHEKQAEFHQRIQEAKDAKSGVPIVKDYLASISNRMSELDKNILAMSKDPLATQSPEQKQSLLDMQAERAALKPEYDELNGYMKKHLGLGADDDAPPPDPNSKPGSAPMRPKGTPANYVFLENGPKGRGFYKPGHTRQVTPEPGQ